MNISVHLSASSVLSVVSFIIAVFVVTFSQFVVADSKRVAMLELWKGWFQDEWNKFQAQVHGHSCAAVVFLSVAFFW